MTKYLGNVVVMDVEKGSWLATVDGKTIIKYTHNQIVEGKPFDDYPGYKIAGEGPHFNPKPISLKDRGAQPFTEDQVNILIDLAAARGSEILMFPGQMAKRVFAETGYKAADACLAWWHYADENEKIKDWVKVLRRKTQRDVIRIQKMNETREMSRRIDTLASLKYKSEEVERCEELLGRAWDGGRISSELADEFGMKKISRGPRKGVIDFNKSQVMSLYVTCFDQDGNYQCDALGNKIGVRKVLSDILQHHAWKSGKGSGASARAKTRKRLERAETRYLKDNGIYDKKLKKISEDEDNIGSYAPPVPHIRKHHQCMNRELVRIFRDYSV